MPGGVFPCIRIPTLGYANPLLMWPPNATCAKALSSSKCRAYAKQGFRGFLLVGQKEPSFPNRELKRVNVDFPQWMIAGLDDKASRLGVNRQAVIKAWIAERLDVRAFV